MPNHTDAALREAVQLLKAHPDFRVLQRFQPYPNYNAAGLTPPAIACFIDVETTGLDTLTDQIIELSVVRFSFAPATGEIIDVLDTYASYEDPGRKLPAEITEKTGIRDADIAGRTIDSGVVSSLVRGAALLIAHNADFDRKMWERRFPQHVAKPWGCSYRDVPWRAHGFDSHKLRVLLADVCDLFYTPHRAMDDALAAVHLLAMATLDGRPAFAHLLERARETTIRIWALNSPFHFKDQLKARGYRWSSGDDGRPKAWYRDVRPEEELTEMQWLDDNVYLDGHNRARRQQVTAWDRYSVRA